MTPLQVASAIDRLSAAGHRVIPVSGKKPVVRGWTGTGVISAAERRNWPYNRADGLAWVLPPGFVVLDFDVRNGRTLDDLLAAVERQFDVMPPLDCSQQTMRGIHGLFRLRSEPDRRARRLLLLDDSAGAVDVKRSRNDIVALYDLAFVEMLGRAPELPAEIAEALTSQRATTSAEVVARAASAVANAPNPTTPMPRWSIFVGQVGNRNNELNDLVFGTARAFELDDIAAAEISALAAGAGLDSAEIEATVAGAWSAAATYSAGSDGWLRTVANTLDGKYPAAEGTYRVATRLAYFAHVRGGRDWVSMSIREIAELLPASISTAHRYVNHLVELGLLSVAEAENGGRSSYALVYPDGELALSASNSNSQPVPPTKQQKPNGPALVVAHEWLAGHRAFHPQHGALAVGSKPILWTLRSGPATTAELKTAARCSTSSLRRYLNALKSAGLVVSKDDRNIRLAEGDLELLLDEFALERGLADRRVKLERQHERDREGYRAAMESRRDRLESIIIETDDDDPFEKRVDDEASIDPPAQRADVLRYALIVEEDDDDPIWQAQKRRHPGHAVVVEEDDDDPIWQVQRKRRRAATTRVRNHGRVAIIVEDGDEEFPFIG